MKKCRTYSKKHCLTCELYDYCDKANRCNGSCKNFDDNICENNNKFVKKDLSAEQENPENIDMSYTDISQELEYEPEFEPDTEEYGLQACDCCGKLFSDVELHSVECNGDTVHYCDDCFDRCYYCNECKLYHSEEDDYIVYRDERVCCSCADEYYHYCEYCECYVYNDDYNFDRGRCYECVDGSETGVEDYHQNDDWEFIGQCKSCWKGKWRGVGIELEIDRNDEDRSVERNTVNEIKNIYGNLKFEYDSSLDNGFEIITHPHTLTEFYKIDWKSILQTCKDNGYVSEDSGTCGLHIHFSRYMFGPDEKTQADSIAKLINFFEHNWEDILRISRRTEKQADNYARKYGVTGVGNIKKLGRSKSKGRYYAVNNTNYNTVEIRIIRGTLNYGKFMASIDLCLNLVKNSRKLKWKDIHCISKWLQGVKPETVDYIRSRSAFSEVSLCA